MSEYDNGYQARINKQPFDSQQSQEWQKGWMDANSRYQMID
jgi:hypothetical protein